MSHGGCVREETPREHVQASASRYRIREGREELLACEADDHLEVSIGHRSQVQPARSAHRPAMKLYSTPRGIM